MGWLKSPKKGHAKKWITPPSYANLVLQICTTIRYYF